MATCGPHLYWETMAGYWMAIHPRKGADMSRLFHHLGWSRLAPTLSSGAVHIEHFEPPPEELGICLWIRVSCFCGDQYLS